MNVAMIAPSRVGDTSGNGGEADSGGGEAFGRAIDTAASKHGQKQVAGRHAATSADGRNSVAEGERGAAADDESDTDAGKRAATGEGAATLDLLNRIAGLSGLGSTGFVAPSAGDAPSDEAQDGALKERIVISTIADLAGSSEPQAAADKGVSLRVTGMETHFEPRIDGARLTDAGDAAPAAAGLRSATVAQGAALATGGPQVSADAPKPRFEEVLRRLDRSGAGTGEAGGEPASAADPNEAAKSQEPSAAPRSAATGSRAETAGFRAVAGQAATTGASASDTAKAPATTGELINMQIAGRIVDSFAGEAATTGDTSATANRSGEPVLRMVAGGAALKTLSIQLEPQDLGRVDVSMRLVDGRLTVELAASEPSTAAALAADKHGLRKILEHAGFALDDAAVTVVARDAGQTGPSATNSSAGGDTGRSGAEQNRGFAGQESGRQGERQRPSGGERQPATTGQESEPAARRAPVAGTIYV